MPSDSRLLRTKLSEKLLLLHPVTSLDDAINLSNAYVIWITCDMFFSIVTNRIGLSVPVLMPPRTPSRP